MLNLAPDILSSPKQGTTTRPRAAQFFDADLGENDMASTMSSEDEDHDIEEDFTISHKTIENE